MLQARGGGAGFLFRGSILRVRGGGGGQSPATRRGKGIREEIMEEGRGEERSWERRRAHSCVVLG